MEQLLGIHCKAFNNKVRVMNQSHAKDLILTAAEARNLHAEIFDLLTQIAELSGTAKTPDQNDSNISLNFDGGAF